MRFPSRRVMLTTLARAANSPYRFGDRPRAPTFADAPGVPGGAVSSTIGGRAFVRVYAVRRDTREQVLLLYEDIAHRRRPIQIIRFHPSVEQTGLDSTRQSERRQ
jgi:hypothetical protein